MIDKTANIITKDEWLNIFASKKHIQSIDKISIAIDIHIGGNDPLKIDVSQDITFMIANTLADMEFDEETIAAAILIYSSKSDKEQIIELLGKPIFQIINGVSQMGLIDSLANKNSTRKVQVSNIHKMLIAMVDDPRVVVIKLVEQNCILSNRSINDKDSQQLATTAMQIYSPLANRLGIGHLKWQLEDSAFKILEPTIYQQLSDGLHANIEKRTKLVDDIVNQINTCLKEFDIPNFDVYGRAKHIYSVYKKMQRKNIGLEKIYDSIAVRIHVPTIHNCYEALSIVHQKWPNIKDEFDDYIVNQKPNGYRSLHTAVNDGRNQFEIQIRTYQMHEEAEFGIAAHWYYKTDKKEKNVDEKKVQWLRDVLEWGDDLSSKNTDNNNIHDDRIYVFTPLGDILDLPKGATPIDFAYSIHTDVGHSCKGATIKGKIIPLNHQLETGDQVFIMTHKSPNPSKNWLIPSNGYIKTSKARLKLTQWLNQQDHDKFKDLGKQAIEKFTKKLKDKTIHLDQIAHDHNYLKTDDLLVAIGKGELKLQSILKEPIKIKKKPTKSADPQKKKPAAIKIHGVGNVLTNIAKCCKPSQTDSIIGYITQGRGVYIHKVTCANMLRKKGKQLDRIINVSWDNELHEQTTYFLEVLAYNRDNIINDIDRKSVV